MTDEELYARNSAWFDQLSSTVESGLKILPAEIIISHLERCKVRIILGQAERLRLEAE